MATQNRTLLFFQYRSTRRSRSHSDFSLPAGKHSKKEEKIKLLEENGHRSKEGNVVSIELQEWDLMKRLEEGWKDGGSSRVDIPPSWVGVIDNVNYDISRIKQKMQDLAEAHKNHLLPKFPMNSDSEEILEEEHKIEALTDYITKTFQQAQIQIQELSKDERRAGSNEKEMDHEYQMRKNVQKMLATKLQELSSEFRKQQQDYLGKLRTRKERGIRASSLSQSSGGSPKMTNGLGGLNNDEYFQNGLENDYMPDTEMAFTESQLSKVQLSNNIVSQRDTEILNIAKSISELSSIFKDLAILVIEQGTILDRIDFNIEQASIQVKKGMKELGSAQKSQRSYTRKLCMLLLCLAILIMVVAISVKSVVT